MARAYSYLRFSSPEQARGDSARRQLELAASYATKHGLELDEELTFADLGVSAYRGRNVEAGRLGDFLELVEVGKVPHGSYLLVENLDRISRENPRRAIRSLESLIDAGIVVVTLGDGTVYSQDSLDAEFSQLLSAMVTFSRSNQESVMKGIRVRAAWDRKKREASSKPLTKVCPSWLQLKEDRSAYEVIPGRGEIVRRIFEMAAAGVGQHTIAATLNEEGVPTFGDSRRSAAIHWHRSYVSKIIQSDAPLGVYVPHSGTYENGRLVRTPWEPVPGYYPAVVDAETARRARLVLRPGQNPKRGRHASAPVRSILAGLARCPDCGGSMTRVSKGSHAKAGPPYLVCSRAKAGAGCSYRAVRLERVEAALRQRADELVFKPTLEDSDGELEEMLAELQGVEAGIKNLLDLVVGGTIGTSARERLGFEEGRKRDLEEAIAARSAHIETTREPLVEKRLYDLRAALKAEPFDLEAANAALRLCADWVEVDYHRGELFVHWRHGGQTDITYWLSEDMLAAENDDDEAA